MVDNHYLFNVDNDTSTVVIGISKFIINNDQTKWHDHYSLTIMNNAFNITNIIDKTIVNDCNDLYLL